MSIPWSIKHSSPPAEKLHGMQMMQVLMESKDRWVANTGPEEFITQQTKKWYLSVPKRTSSTAREKDVQQMENQVLGIHLLT